VPTKQWQRLNEISESSKRSLPSLTYSLPSGNPGPIFPCTSYRISRYNVRLYIIRIITGLENDSMPVQCIKIYYIICISHVFTTFDILNTKSQCCRERDEGAVMLYTGCRSKFAEKSVFLVEFFQAACMYTRLYRITAVLFISFLYTTRIVANCGDYFNCSS